MCDLDYGDRLTDTVCVKCVKMIVCWKLEDALERKKYAWNVVTSPSTSSTLAIYIDMYILWTM